MATTRIAVADTVSNTRSSDPATPEHPVIAPQTHTSSSIQPASTAVPHQSHGSGQKTLTGSDESTPIRLSNSQNTRNYSTSEVAASPASHKTGGANREDRAGGDNAAVADDHQSWYKRMAEKYGSITLENKGSVARDHLALERTFLAWLRTSLSFASIGIAITQLFRLNASKSKGQSKRSFAESRGDTTAHDLPLSPFLGHAIPAEVLPYLEHIVAEAQSLSDTSKPVLGPTLLDQIMHLSSIGGPVASWEASTAQLNNDVSHKLRHVGKPLGATFIGISVVVLLIGFQRYFEAQHWIIHGKYPASRGSISLVAFVALALIVASLVIVVAVSPTSYEQ